MFEEIKVSDLVKLIDLFNGKKQNESVVSFFEIGKCYFIRTVTMYLIGKLIKISDKELLLENASWIADTGRFHNALMTGELNEIEPFINPVILNRDCIIDATYWQHKLPTDQK
jgi:hypothetical protein